MHTTSEISKADWLSNSTTVHRGSGTEGFVGLLVLLVIATAFSHSMSNQSGQTYC